MRERSRNPIFWWLVKKTKTPLHMGILRGQEPAPPPQPLTVGRGLPALGWAMVHWFQPFLPSPTDYVSSLRLCRKAERSSWAKGRECWGAESQDNSEV